MKKIFIALIGMAVALPSVFAGNTWCVSTNGNDANSGASWTLAKKTIQAGVDVAVKGDTVLVTNGEYVLSGQITVTNNIIVCSVNGPTGTIVNGNGQVTLSRCFYLATNCTLDGFTVTNGYLLTADGGGVYCVNTNAVITNCALIGNSAHDGGGTYGGTLNNCTLINNVAFDHGGGAYNVVLNNCTLTDNSAHDGGGAYTFVMNDCTLSGNSAADWGGGAYGGTLNNCTLINNSAIWDGGGTYNGTLNNCTLSGNSAGWGGGAADSTLNNCTLTDNSASQYGGGANGGTLNNCTLTDNTTSKLGGGASGGTLNNCTLAGNTAGTGGGALGSTLNNCTITGNSAKNGDGGGTCSGTLNNCIVFYNSGTNNISGGTIRYTCAPDAPEGFGNITDAPMFVNTNTGNYRLTAGSLCINAGHNSLAPTNVTPVDLDGNPRIWNITVDMGAYEYGSVPSAPTGLVASDGVYYDKIRVTWLSVVGATGYEVWVSTSNLTSEAGKLSDTTATNYDDTAAITETIYYYWVKTKTASSTSDFSLSNSGYRAALPSIISQPQSQTQTVGGSATFSLTATGTVPLYYHWQKNVTNISVATNTSFVINPVAKTNEGGYRCIVSNMVGCVTSSVATLVVKANQTIAFGNPGPQLTTNMVGLVMSSDSSLAVTGSVISGSASIANGTNLTFTGYGNVTIQASQTGDVNYAAATPVNQTFAVTRATATVNLTMTNQPYNGAARPVTTSTVPVGLPLTVTYAGNAWAPTNVGSYVVTGMVDSAHAIYQGTSVVTLTIGHASQTITFGNPGSQLTTNSIGLVMTSDSSLAVTGSVISGSASIANGTNLTFTGYGSVTIRASQTGNVNYAAATPVDQIFTVTRATATVNLTDLIQNYNGTARPVTTSTVPVGLPLTVTYAGNAWAPTNAGSYVVTGMVNSAHAMYQGTSVVTLTVNGPPSLGAVTVSNIMANTAYLGGNIIATNGYPVTERGIYWGTNSGTVLAVGTNYSTNGTFGTGVFSFFVTNLPAGRTNYFLAYAVNSQGTNFTPTNSFLTRPSAPVVLPPTNGTINTFWANWQTVESATNYWLDVAPTNDFASYLAGYSNRMVVTALTYSVTGLQARTEYYYRVRAENGTGVGINSATQTVSAAAIGLLPGTLTYTGTFGGSNPAAQPVIVTNLGNRGFDFTNTTTYSAGATGWWTSTPATGRVNGLMAVAITGSVSLTGINAGTHYATNAIVSADATNSPQYLVVTLTVSNAAQAITNFTPVSGSAFATTSTVMLAAQANSGLPVTFELVSGPGQLGGATLTFTNAGEVKIRALQTGDANRNAAPSLTNIYTVTKVAATVSLGNLTQIFDGNAKTVTITTLPAGLLVDMTYAGNSWAPTNVGTYAVNGVVNSDLYQGSTNGMLTINSLPAPVAQAATMINSNNFVANWGTVSTATNYFVDVASINNFSSYLGGFSNFAAGNVLSCTVTGASIGNTYYYRVRAQNSGMTSTNSETISVTIRAVPTLGAASVSNVMAHTAYLGGIVTASNACSVTERGIYWGTNSGSVRTNGTNRSESGAFGVEAFSFLVTNLPAGRTNYFLAYAVNSQGTNLMGESSFLTRPDAPMILPPTNITANALYANWQLAESSTNYWLDVAVTNDFATYLAGYSNRAAGLALTCSVTGLETRVVYYYRVRSENATGVSTDSTVMTVSKGAIGLLPASLSYGSVYGGTNPAAQSFVITNSGYWDFNFTNSAAYSPNTSGWWLATPVTGALAGTAYQAITGNVDITGLNAGTYYVTNAVIASEATNSPKYLVATLTVGKGNQTIINFTPMGGSSFATTSAVQLFAQASSELAATNFTVLSGPGVLDATRTNLTFTNSGVVSVTVNQAGNTNWNPSPTVTNTFNVGMVTAVVTLTNLTQTYDGTPRVVGATTVPGGLSVSITYNGSGSAPTAAGNYAVTGVVNSALYQGSANGTLSVSKAAATVTLNNLNQTYDGTARSVTATTVPASLAVLITYDGSATAPVNVGSYAVIGTVNEASYAGVTNSTLVVAKANQAITFPAISDQEVASVVALSATASSGLTVSYAATGPAVLNGNAVSFTGAGTVSIVASQAGNANWNAAVNVTRNVTVNANPPPSAPTGVQASDGAYTDKVRVTWNAAGDATGYQVWRSMSNNTVIASNLGTTATTTYDDFNAATTPGTILYYWVKAVNAAGPSGFSAGDTGYVRPAIGPTIKANGAVGDVTVNYPDAMAITIEMNEDPYGGAPVDWWVLSLAGSSWYYLNSSIQWAPYDGNLANCHPLYQGGSCNLPAYLLPALNIPGLPVSSYTFWFAVDAQMDGILNLDEQLLADSVNVNIQSALPAPRIKANGATGIVTVNYPGAMSITIELDARAYAGVPADWWVLLNAGSAWFYMDSAVGWTQAGDWRPVYQGTLGNLPALEVLNIAGLGAGSYTFYFAVDLPMNGVLNMEQIWVDAVTVNVQ